MVYDHHNYLMKRTVQARAQESKEDDQRAARQGCKGSRMLLHPGDDDDDDESTSSLMITMIMIMTTKTKFKMIIFIHPTTISILVMIDDDK